MTTRLAPKTYTVIVHAHWGADIADADGGPDWLWTFSRTDWPMNVLVKAHEVVFSDCPDCLKRNGSDGPKWEDLGPGLASDVADEQAHAHNAAAQSYAGRPLGVGQSGNGQLGTSASRFPDGTAPAERMLRASEIWTMGRFSEPQFRKLLKEGRFPKSILRAGLHLWPESVVIAALKALEKPRK